MSFIARWSFLNVFFLLIVSLWDSHSFCGMLQGYVVYSTKHKLKQEYVGLPSDEIKNLKASGVEVRLWFPLYC